MMHVNSFILEATVKFKKKKVKIYIFVFTLGPWGFWTLEFHQSGCLKTFYVSIHLFRRMLQHCFSVKLKKCFVTTKLDRSIDMRMTR